MQIQEEENEAINNKVREIMLRLDRMLEIANELQSTDYKMDSWKGKAKRVFTEKYEGVVKELIDSLEYSSRLTAMLKQSIEQSDL